MIVTARHLVLTSALALAAGALSCTPKASDEDTAGRNDGVNAPQADDADGDGIIDVNEGEGDADRDGVPNYLDTDSDGDCIPDSIEKGHPDDPWAAPVNSDGDANPDFLDLDSDENGVPDEEEVGNCTSPRDADGDGIANYCDTDDDSDTIPDAIEGFSDRDGDGTPNARDDDSDADCLRDALEAGDADPSTAPVDTDGDGTADYLDEDSDGDGTPDYDEVAGSCDSAPDWDGDGVPDHLDDDIDGDGLANAEEATLGSDPRDRDTDDDGATDGLEAYAGTNPVEAAEVPPGVILTTGPRQRTEGAGEYTVDALRLDIFLLLDTSYSYSCYHPVLPAFAEDLVNAVFTRFDNVAVGLGYYDDYNYSTGWAAPGGLPFRLAHQISTDTTSIKAAAATQNMVYGGDSYGSAYEGILQVLRGLGFDQNSDGAKDTSTDVMPFIASAADAFGGAVTGTYNATVPGTGSRPGVGWRTGATRIVLMSADNTIREAELGHDMPSGCTPAAATFATASGGLSEAEIKIVSMNVYEYQSSDHTLQQQLLALAAATGSYYDADGDGIATDPAVFYGSWNWPDINDVVEALWDLSAGATVNLWLELGDDPRGWVSSLSGTEATTGLQQGDTLDFTFEITTAAPTLPDDQFYRATIKIMSDAGEYDEENIWLVIRPETVI